MDHVWNSLYQWKVIWEERIEEEKNGPDYEGKHESIKYLTSELNAIKRAMKEISKYT